MLLTASTPPVVLGVEVRRSEPSRGGADVEEGELLVAGGLVHLDPQLDGEGGEHLRVDVGGVVVRQLGQIHPLRLPVQRQHTPCCT